MSILQDVRLALRLFRRNWAGTAIALLSIWQRYFRISRAIRAQRRQDRVRSALVVAEVALSVMLVVVGVHLLEGRWFREEDMSESSDAAMVNDFAALTAGMVCWIPTRRVTRIDPMSALRVE